jgi:hypothetical protein
MIAGHANDLGHNPALPCHPNASRLASFNDFGHQCPASLDITLLALRQSKGPGQRFHLALAGALYSSRGKA